MLFFIGALSKKSLRLVPEVEIGMAILRCTIEQFCNPAFLQIENFAGFHRTSTSQLMITKSKVLIENTCENGESLSFKRPNKPKTVIDSIELSEDDYKEILQVEKAILLSQEDDDMVESVFEESCLPSAVFIPETMQSSAGIFSAVNIPETKTSQNSLEPIESQPRSSKNASNFFEFDTFKSKNTKKRIAPTEIDEEEDEAAVDRVIEKEAEVIAKPAAKKAKINPIPKIVHPDSDEEIVAPVLRKRTSATKGEMFSFNRLVKRTRQMSIELDNSNSIDSVNSATDICSGLSRVSSGESLLPSIPQSKRQRSFSTLSGSTINYSGVWLSKSFANCSIKTLKEEDIKNEEIDGLGTEDIKPQNICIYFQVQQIKMDLKSVTDRSDSICNESGQKKFKKFVKKKNFKSQSEVLRTKLVSADETFDQNVDF